MPGSTRLRWAWRQAPPRWSALPSARPVRRAPSWPMRAKAASRLLTSSPRRSSSDRRSTAEGLQHMAEILVLVDHDGDAVKKVSYELLTLARSFGEPAAVWAGPGAEAGRERLAEFGAGKGDGAGGGGVGAYLVVAQGGVA